ncbi:hypothetical protein V8E54_013838 [Elaphomyces granulatus]
MASITCPFMLQYGQLFIAKLLSYVAALHYRYFCLQPGDPNDTDGDEDEGREDEPRRSYAQLCPPLANPQVSFCGPVSAIPVPTGENKIFSLDIHAYLKKEAGTPRWGNTFVPRLGQWTTVSGEIVGEYKVNKVNRYVDDFVPAPAAKDDDTPMPPTGSSNTQTTPSGTAIELVPNPEAKLFPMDDLYVLCTLPPERIMFKPQCTSDVIFPEMGSNAIPIFTSLTSLKIDNMSIRRLQVPVTPTWAVTDYKMQSSTCDAVTLQQQ